MPVAANAQCTPWLVRVRALHLESANKNSTGLDLSINNRCIPELDVSYLFAPELTLELVLPCPHKQKLRSGGSVIDEILHDLHRQLRLLHQELAALRVELAAARGLSKPMPA